MVGQCVMSDHLTSVVGGPHLTGMVGQCVRPDQPPPSEQLGAGMPCLRIRRRRLLAVNAALRACFFGWALFVC